MNTRWLLLIGCFLVGSASADDGFISMFDGKTFQGWKQVGGAAKYRVEGDEVVGTVEPEMKGNAFLRTEKTYGDFILRLDLKLEIPGNNSGNLAVRLKFQSKAGNSGLYFRSEEGGSLGVRGFQAEIDPKVGVGGLYETEGRGWVVQPRPEDVVRWLKPRDWNELSVVALGDRTVVHLNGAKLTEVDDPKGRKRGKFALQLHGGQDVDVRFKDVEILDLGQSGASPP